MSNPIDQLIDDGSNVPDDNINYDLLPFLDDLSRFPDHLTEEFSTILNTNEDFADILMPTMHSLDTITLTPSGYSPENNSNQQELSNAVAQAVVLPRDATSLEIIAQPYYGTKLRYRSDYDKNESRLGVLKNRNKNSSYQGPAVRIPQDYLIPNGEYFIRVSLVTVPYNQTNLHYFHPYELEHPSNEQLNEPLSNAAWFVIQNEDCVTGIKSFPALRIVKKRASDFKPYGNLRLFDCHDQNSPNNSLPQLTNAKDTIKEYNLDRSQLAFTVGRKTIDNDGIVTYLYLNTTVFSEEMIEGASTETDGDSAHSSSEKPVSSPLICRVYKYAPRYGFDGSHEDMVIFLTNKLEPKKYGELKVLFECDTSQGRWSQPVADLDVKDRMVSFKTPIFPYSFDMTQVVDVILRQDNRTIDTIKYFYLATLDKCSRCQSRAVENPINVIPNMSVKRPTYMMDLFYTEKDVFELPSENSPKLQQSLSEPVPELLSSSSSANTSNSTSLPLGPVTHMAEDPHEQLMITLATSVESLFINNDYSPFLRLSRSFLRKSPELFHNAIINNHTDLLLKFIPVASSTILQQRNELGETALLHAVRLNRTEMIKAILERNNSETLLQDLDAKDNNIFHIMASNSTSTEILELVTNYIFKKSINIQKFDQINQDHLTPLQLAITKNNLPVTKALLKHSNTNVHQTKDLTGDNLIHLAVRYGGLSLVKYLIEEGKLTDQSEQSNLTMTPSELARSLQRDDIIKYFNEIHPQQEIDEDDSSDDD